MPNTLFIKNMVCPRCITAVQELFSDLNIPFTVINLGKVEVLEPLSDQQREQLATRLKAIGFTLIDDHQTQLMNQIKSIVIEQIHHISEASPVNFSTLLSEQLHYEYGHLSRLFSAVEGRTIEHFVIAQKIERIKELLMYEELTLSEIAFKMHYSSAAHLSSQFKKVTGMSPTSFKKLVGKDRRSLDAI